MRYLRASLLLGGLVAASAGALWVFGAFAPWDELLLRLAGPESALRAAPVWVVPALVVLLAFGLAWTTIDIPRSGLKALVAAGALLQVPLFTAVAALSGVAIGPSAPFAAGALAFLGGLLYARSEGGRRKQRLLEVLGGRTSQRTMRRLLNSAVALPFDGVRAPVTVLVCEFSHGDRPGTPTEEVVRLNSFLHRAGELLAEHGGYLDECDAEGVRALFFDPVAEGTPALAALRAAKALAELPEPGVAFGIGVESEEMTLGVFGPGEAGALGAAGPALEFARRLGRWNGGFGTRVLAGPGTHAAATSAWEFRPAALLRPPAWEVPAEIYEPMGPETERAPEAELARSLYWEALILFREKRWHDALSRFTRARDLSGPDPLCERYIQKTRAALGGGVEADGPGGFPLG